MQEIKNGIDRTHHKYERKDIILEVTNCDAQYY
nr:hypothetical protein [Bacteroides sp.]